ncbi:MAG: N-acyl homoserine lactonase family protein [Alphaproteobacteria bacterium]|nr:MAG: N-acyl homoserine lactonase family protein [Alphaproteobacteria bacterium]
MKHLIAALGACLLAMPAAAQQAPDIELWRLDCGTIELSDAAPFSDAHLYDGEQRTLTDSCYLIRNGEQYLLWDAGLPAMLKGTSNTQGVFTVSVTETIEDQLAKLGLEASDITFAGISHYHFDHIGQLPTFGSATLLINKNDWDFVTSQPETSEIVNTAFFSAWQGENAGKVDAFPGDKDVFGDGSVVIKGMPGHTPGHSSLLVRLPDTGNVMLTGDLYHFEEQITNRGVPQFNTNRADTLASFERFNATVKALEATVVIQHDPRHISRLPAFPESAK